MKLLIYEWNSYLQYDLKQLCKEKGIETVLFSWKFTNKNVDDRFRDWFRKNVQLNTFDAVISINYFPLISEACKEQNTPYIAWCYDNPLNVVEIEETLGNANNYVFFFDKVQTQFYLNKGFETVYYAPLGVNRTRLEQLSLSNVDYSEFGCDVSFVGSLYESRIHEIMSVVGEYERGYLKALMNAQQNLYGYYLFDEMVTDDFVAGINDRIQRKNPETEFVLLKEALTFAMASEVTRKDRLVLLTLLGKRFDTKLYSFQSSEVLQGVSVHAPIDYVSQMPKVFATSKINLNPILRCIQSGIPLRALDVMGAGGFLLSSYQPELLEYFLPDKEMVVYDNMEDAVEKATFYLTHESFREKICRNGQRKVLTDFNLQDRLNQILRVVLDDRNGVTGRRGLTIVHNYE